METKKSPKADLEIFIRIFRQLGLVLTLFVVFITIEHKTFERSSKNLIAITTATNEEEEIIEFEVEQIVKPPPPAPAAPVVIEIVEDMEEVEETVIESTETDETERIEVDEIIEVVEEEEVIEDIPFAIIEKAPVFPGCEKLKGNEKKKDCFNKSMQKHIARNFNIELASDLGLPIGTQRIYIQFKISKTGSINILGARAPHVRLESEAKRIVGLLPKMIPGEQRGTPVNVTYMLPITFQIE